MINRNRQKLKLRVAGARRSGNIADKSSLEYTTSPCLFLSLPRAENEMFSPCFPLRTLTTFSLRARVMKKLHKRSRNAFRLEHYVPIGRC